MYKMIRWKALLGIFKLKRIVNAFLGIKRLDYQNKNILIHTNTLREFETRANSCRKEPETCAWINEIKKEGDVLYDIGANIGAYSLIAGSEGMKVVAFEPSPENYATLHKNIVLNNLQDNIMTLPLVLGSEGKMHTFSIDETTSGATAGFVSSHPSKRGITLPVVTLNECVTHYKLPIPNAIKIDVDGGEIDVLKGADKILQSETLKHVLVEVESSLFTEVDTLLQAKGFSKKASYERHEGVSNIIYTRV